MNTPKIVVAGATSGVGKTAITTAIMYALTKNGFHVQPFKIGPDFIDPSYHNLVTGRPSRNLDVWMMGKNGVLKCFNNSSQGADVAIIEGVMGLFDGLSGKDDYASTAQIAKMLDAPVILVIDAGKAARSIAAIALGFLHFDKKLKIAGFILNNVAGDKHAKFVQDAFACKINVPIIGIVRRERKITIEERHLGLIPALELEKKKRSIHQSAKYISEQIDIDKIKSLCKPINKTKAIQKEYPDTHIRVAVALDESFNFYYADNFDALRKQQAELIFFSPVNDVKLPENIQGIILGGGFPEILADKLEFNQAMIKSISKTATNGMPIYGECGGLMYLTRSIRTNNEGKKKRQKMVGLIEADTFMSGKLTLNYTEADCTSSFFEDIYKIRGHEFHYSNIENISTDSKFAYNMRRGNGVDNKRDGFVVYNCLASYMHLHFANNRLPERFIKSCLEFSHK
ncbi:MAG: hydrogenobyrinic acid a,c-diamide synthase (glutamine-hydrolyzing) [Thermoproteota archaeon]|nr:hydrogenobyrinic acid a,c-diamide synthase (glutamine-hydrolyzing) [Thermoproteota archaeon]